MKEKLCGEGEGFAESDEDEFSVGGGFLKSVHALFGSPNCFPGTAGFKKMPFHFQSIRFSQVFLNSV